MPRLIADIDYNTFLKTPFQHRPTNIVPNSILERRMETEAKAVCQRTDTVLTQLVPLLGKPYFSDSGFILYHGDCLEKMPLLQKNGFTLDLTITSPPYNIGKEYEHQLSIEQYVNWCSQWMQSVFTLTSETGAFWLNLGYFEVPNKGRCVPISYLLWDKSQFFLQQEIVWNYGAGVSTKKRLCPRNEKWLFYVKNPEEYTFNLDDIRDPNVKYPNSKKNGKFRCNPLGKNPSDVWAIPKITTGAKRSSKERTAHPAQFPLALVERIVRVSSNPADIILDPFAGSCSTGIAAHGLGRVFIGFEIQEKYCELSVERFKQYQQGRQLKETQCSFF